MTKKILMSLSVIAAVAAIAFGATTAFFSDTETSTGNTFTAGAIDLRIDNESYVTDCNIPPSEGNLNPPCTGKLVASANTSWELKDLTIEKFFNFVDVKPGDLGEDTISIHVGSNDAWMCAAAQVTSDLDNSMTEPEDETALPAGDGSDGTTDGDLDTALRFAFWKDDGDNVLETDEVASIFANGTLANLGRSGKIALAQPGDSGPSVFGGTPVAGGSTSYIAKAWCFGNLSANAVTQDGYGKPNLEDNDTNNDLPNGPLVRGTGVLCDGSNEGNIAQTDSVTGDIEFYAEQSRNNPNFSCANWRPSWTPRQQ